MSNISSSKIYRILGEAYYIINKDATVRETAKIFNVSKSTVHHDVTACLDQIHNQIPNQNLSQEIRRIFDEHIARCTSNAGKASGARRKRSK